MNRKIYNEYVTILESELVPALGCTEPIALAYAAAKAKEVLGKMPDHITMRCSGNIIKNVKGVKVPNSGGMKGVEAAAVLGITGGDPSQALEVLEHVTDREIDEAEKLLKAGFCDCVLKDDVANLYIEAYAVCKKTEKSEALVVIEDEHTNITHIEKDGQVLFHKEKKEYCQEREKTPDKSLLNLEDIITFAKGVTCGYVQLGGCIVSKAVAEYFEEHVLQCGLTYSGHTLACAAGVAALTYYKEHDIEGHVAKMHEIVAPFMDEMVKKHKCIGEARCIGLFGALEVVKNKETREPMQEYGVPGPVMPWIFAELKKRGFATFGRENFIEICPPLIITEEELKEYLPILDEVLTMVDEKYCD